jgi:hypothetical protein
MQHCISGRAGFDGVMRPGGRFTFKRLMEQQGFEALVKSKAILSRLERIMDPKNPPQVIAWHQALSEKEQIEWSSPSSVIKAVSGLRLACSAHQRFLGGRQFAAVVAARE